MPEASHSDRDDRKAMAVSPRIAVVLCTYNEAGNLPKMFALLREHLPQADILVVDDNSPDGTADIVRKHAIDSDQFHLLLRAGKLGLGTATRDGLNWCLEHDYDYCINLDADLSHNPASAPVVLQACQRIECGVAIGSRYIDGGGFDGLAWHRRLISRALNTYATRLLRLPISDCSGSFRCYSKEALGRIDLSKLTCPGYGFLEEILVALKQSGAKFVEVPICFDTRYRGESKLSLRDAFGAIQVIHKLALRR